MIQFFTRIPVPVEIECDNEDFGKGLVFAPLIGLMIGGLLLGSYSLLVLVFPVQVTVVFVVLIYIALTGGLHLDGLADTFDGLLSGRSRERMLEIMKDSRIGTFGVLALVGVILSYVVLLQNMDKAILPMVFLLMPVAGRIGSLVSAGISSYAREEGLGKSFIDYCSVKELIIGIVMSFIIFYLFLGLHGVSIVYLVHMTAIVLTYMLTRKLKGATGDVLGAVCELNQLAFMLLAFFMM